MKDIDMDYAPERIHVEFEAGSHEGTDNSKIMGYEYKNRDVRDLGYFHGEYIRKDKYDELLKAVRYYAAEGVRPNDGPWGVKSTDFGLVAVMALSVYGEFK